MNLLWNLIVNLGILNIKSKIFEQKFNIQTVVDYFFQVCLQFTIFWSKYFELFIKGP